MGDTILIVIGIIAILLNILLIIVTFHITNRTDELGIILGLAVVDSLLPLVAIIVGIEHTSAGPENFGFIPCSIKGPFDFGLMVISVMLVSIIAIKRYTKVTEQKLPRSIWVCLFTTISCYILLLIIAAVKGEFQASLGQVDCTPQPQKYYLSGWVMFLFGFILLLFFTITLACYLRIIFMVSTLRQQCELIEMKSNNELNNNPLPVLSHRPVLIRTISICIIYGLLIVPASILIMLEAITPNLPKPPAYSITISIFLSSIAIANPILVLFAHAIIFQSLTNLLNPFRSPQNQPLRL